MPTINQKGQHQPPQKQITPLIQSYLSSQLFKHSLKYQTLTQTHAPYLQFIYDKIPKQTNLPTSQQKYIFASIFKDMETKHVICCRLIRILIYRHCLICLVVDHDLGVVEEDKFFVLVVVFRSRSEAQQWKEQYSFLTLISISEPYRFGHKVSLHLDSTLFVTTPEHIKVEARFRLESFSTDKVRVMGNQKFKNKKYIEALYDYQFGLGLCHNPQNKRERAILYANSSQCLFEMRLFQSALLYADASSTIDKHYPKGIYKKFTCYLQLAQLKHVPTCLRTIHEVCSPKEFQAAQKMFNRSTIQHHGLFNWKQILRGQKMQFNQYVSVNIKKQVTTTSQYSLEKNKEYYVADCDISQHEMILLTKPLIYCNSQQQTFGENYTSLISQIMNYCDLQDLFYERFIDLPSQSKFQGHVLKYNKNRPEGVEMNQIHAKCLRCLELQKVISLAQGEKQCLGIWDHLYLFQHSCNSNCTYLHIKGGLAVFAVKDIKEGQTLSIDFLNWQTTRRQSLMMQKLGFSCDCIFCEWQWDMDIGTQSASDLYEIYQQQEQYWQQAGCYKLMLYYLWNLIYTKKYKEVQLMKEYLILLQKYPLWQCIINCLKYLKVRPRNDVFDHIKSKIKKCLEKYFKIGHQDAVGLLKQIL